VTALGPIGLAIVGVVVVALVALVAMARRKAWNADGSDDAKRRLDE
jgi:hypothetical protein